jgi:hypothetical protein
MADGMNFASSARWSTRCAGQGPPLSEVPSHDHGAGGLQYWTDRVLLLAAGLLTGAGAFAQDYAIREVAGWTVTASRDGKGCFLTRAYQGSRETTLLLGLDSDGSNRLSLLNANWSIKPKERESLDFRLSNASFPRHLAVGIASDGKRGFVTSFGERFPAIFAASTFLHVSRGTVPVERLSLRGSGAAVAELRRCVASQRGRRAPDAPGGESDIPVDPFASGAERKRQD